MPDLEVGDEGAGAGADVDDAAGGAQPRPLVRRQVGGGVRLRDVPPVQVGRRRHDAPQPLHRMRSTPCSRRFLTFIDRILRCVSRFVMNSSVRLHFPGVSEYHREVDHSRRDSVLCPAGPPPLRPAVAMGQPTVIISRASLEPSEERRATWTLDPSTSC